jgi:hypothetical protein
VVLYIVVLVCNVTHLQLVLCFEQCLCVIYSTAMRMDLNVKFPHMSDRNCNFSNHKCPFPTLFLSAAAMVCEHGAHELHKLFYLSFWSCDSCRHLPEPKHHSFLLTTDLLLNVLFSWLLVHLPSTFFLDVLFFFFPLVTQAFNRI